MGGSKKESESEERVRVPPSYEDTGEADCHFFRLGDRKVMCSIRAHHTMKRRRAWQSDGGVQKRESEEGVRGNYTMKRRRAWQIKGQPRKRV